MTLRKLLSLLSFVAMVVFQPVLRSEADGIPLTTYLSLTDVAWISASPDGSHIAYTSEETGSWQLWVADADGSHRRQVTHSGISVNGAWWIAGAEHTILFTESQGGSGIDQFFTIHDDGSASTALFPTEKAVTHVFGAFSRDGSEIAFSSNRRNEQAFDVYIYDRKTKKTRRVFTSSHSAFATAWSPDAKKLLVQVVYGPYNADLNELDLRTGASRLLTPHAGQSNFDSSQFTPDMRSVVCVSNFHNDFHVIQRIDLAARTIRPILHLRRDIDQVLLSPDGRSMAYIVNKGGYGEIVVASATGKTIGTPTMSPYIAENLVFARKNVLLYAASGPTFPKVVWSYNPETRRTLRILQPNFHEIPPGSLVEPQIVNVRSFDGTIVPAWYFRPKHHHGRLTVLLDIHGGPELQDRAWFYPFAQYWCSRGYALLDPNIRGSSGYGRSYLHAADGRKRENAVKDIGALLDWLKTTGEADRRNIFIDGASYGGYIVLSSLYHYPRAFAGGMDFYGVADWESFLQNTGEVRSARESIYGDPDRDRKFLQSMSPLHHVSEIKSPVLIVAGANDQIVPVAQSKYMARALRQHNVSVELHIFPDAGHGIPNVHDLVELYRWMMAFVQRYVRH